MNSGSSVSDPKFQVNVSGMEGVESGNHDMARGKAGMSVQNNGPNNSKDADMVELDKDYMFNDPKRKRLDNECEPNLTDGLNGLPKNVKEAGLHGGVCLDK